MWATAMLAMATLTTLILGGLWVADTLFGFRMEGVSFLYPFPAEARQTAGFLFLAAGVILLWVESKHNAKRLHH